MDPFTILHRDTVADLIVEMYYTVHCRTITRKGRHTDEKTFVFPAYQLPLLAVVPP